MNIVVNLILLVALHGSDRLEVEPCEARAATQLDRLLTTRVACGILSRLLPLHYALLLLSVRLRLDSKSLADAGSLDSLLQLSGI